MYSIYMKYNRIAFHSIFAQFLINKNYPREIEIEDLTMIFASH